MLESKEKKMRDKFEQFESLTNGLKNVAIIAAGIALIIFLWPSITAVLKGEKEVESFEALGVGLTLTDAVNKAAKQEGTSDESIPEPIVQAVERIEVGGAAWSFVGTYQNGYSNPNFLVSAVPAEGDEIKAQTDIYRRAREPKFTITGWKMGKVEGLIKTGQVLRVKEIARIPALGGGYQDWVKGTILK
jgi:hypothetical protein